MFLLELPGDEWGNRAYTNSGACVIQCEPALTDLSPYCVRVCAPQRIAVNRPTLSMSPWHAGEWLEVPRHGPARDLTETEYVMLLMEVAERVAPWRLRAAMRRAGLLPQGETSEGEG